MQQIRHAVETGVLRDGDLLPGIRSLAEELVVSHNTVAKAYSELEHEGLLDLRHGSGAYVLAGRSVVSRADKVRRARDKVLSLLESLLEHGLDADEIRRLFEAELLYPATSEKKR